MKLYWDDLDATDWDRHHAAASAALQQDWAYGSCLKAMGVPCWRVRAESDGRTVAQAQFIGRRVAGLASVVLCSRGPVWIEALTAADKAEAQARFSSVAGIVTTDAGETDDTLAPAETLVLDADLTDSDAQLIWQHRQSDGKMNSGQQAGAGGSAATAPRSDIDLRTEQYERLSERLAESLGQRLAAQIAKGDWKVEMALHPSELGNIDIELNMNKGQLEATFNASQPGTQALIADGLPRLKEVLAQLGMEVASMQVNVRQQGQNGGNPTPRREPSGVAGVSSKRGDDGKATAATSPAPRSGGITNDGLDLLA